LDRTRAEVLRVAVRVPWLGERVRRRDGRVGLRATLAILFALVLTIAAPALALAISPIVFGVPHVAASVRYLVVRQGLGRAKVAFIVVCSVLITALRVAEQYAGALHAWARAEVAVASVWVIAAAVAAGFDGGRWRRVAVAVPALLATAAACFAHPIVARLAFVHVHNLGVVLIWVVLFRSRLRGALVPVVLLVLAVVLVLSGATIPWTARLGGLAAAGVDLTVVGSWLLPGAAATVAVPLVLAHALTDSVHYAFWLTVIPEETLRGEGTLTFRMTVRAIARDLGRPLALAVVVAFAFVVVLALVDLGVTRDAYFAFAGFHGYVEATMLVYLAVRGSRERASLGSP
jgi:hypothetical protein